MIVLGHRGGRGPGWPPENSLAAFARAFDEGADGIELDVRLCASGEVVVVHDKTLARVTDGRDRRRVAAVRHRELPLLAGGARIPTLDEALDMARGKIVNVELKSDVPSRRDLVRATLAVARRFPSAAVVFSSFDPVTVLIGATLAPRHEHAMLVGPRTPRLAVPLPRALRRTSRAVVAAHLDVGIAIAPRIAKLRAAGMRVVVWTVNDGARTRDLHAAGADWLITDRPAECRASLAPG